jgi:hypothetical protein
MKNERENFSLFLYSSGHENGQKGKQKEERRIHTQKDSTTNQTTAAAQVYRGV